MFISCLFVLMWRHRIKDLKDRCSLLQVCEALTCKVQTVEVIFLYVSVYLRYKHDFSFLHVSAPVFVPAGLCGLCLHLPATVSSIWWCSSAHIAGGVKSGGNWTRREGGRPHSLCHRTKSLPWFFTALIKGVRTMSYLWISARARVFLYLLHPEYIHSTSNFKGLFEA